MTKKSLSENNMVQRVLSAAVLLAVIFVAIFLSEISAIIFMAACAMRCVYEFTHAVYDAGHTYSAPPLYTYVVVTAILSLLHSPDYWYTFTFAVCVVWILLCGMRNTTRSEKQGNGAVDSGIWSLIALSYTCFLFAFVFRSCVGETRILVFLLGCIATWVCDSFALFGGMLFGKHKLCPYISPKKTIEGAVSGSLFATLSGALVWLLPPVRGVLPLWVCMVITGVCGTVGQVGDLMESHLKRLLGIKDFSTLIPGHGGMMDRSDSLLVSVPTAYLLVSVFLSIGK